MLVFLVLLHCNARKLQPQTINTFNGDGWKHNDLFHELRSLFSLDWLTEIIKQSKQRRTQQMKRNIRSDRWIILSDLIRVNNTKHKE